MISCFALPPRCRILGGRIHRLCRGVAMKRMAVPVVLLVVVAVAAAQEAKPDQLVKTAVEAAGGTEALNKLPAGRVVGKGTIAFAGSETPVSFEQVYHVPGR